MFTANSTFTMFKAVRTLTMFTDTRRFIIRSGTALEIK